MDHPLAGAGAGFDAPHQRRMTGPTDPGPDNALGVIGMVVSAGFLMVLFCPWAAVMGWRLRDESQHEVINQNQ